MATRRPVSSRTSKPKARTASRTQKIDRAKPAALRPKSSSRANHEHGLLARFYLLLAHAVGAGARALSPDRIAPEDRRDGLPFAIFLGGIIGAWFTWFLHPTDAAFGVHIWTIGLLFGKVSYILPVVMVIFAVYLMRHPSTVRDNGRIGIGLFLFLVAIAGFLHIFGGAPKPPTRVLSGTFPLPEASLVG
jgi:S-DNA-T family DNA segregation ATPase FtsK/SpoIIIE